MTSVWLISSSLLLWTAVHAADVKGQVELAGSREARAARKRDYSGVAVWLVPLQPGPSLPGPQPPATMIQKNKAFLPHVLAIQEGAAVDFPNYDPIFHNAFSNYDGRVFDLGLYPPGTSRRVTFDRPGIVRVFCNIHASMSAVIVVVATPWFTVTGPSGLFTVRDVPAGLYSLHFFHERATAGSLNSLRRVVSILPPVVDLGLVRISEAGYLPLPHKNKYGLDYGPENENNHAYPAPAK